MDVAKKGGRTRRLWIIIVILVMVGGIFPPSQGKMPLFYDDNGNIIPESISEKIYIDIGGTEIGLLIT